jgi:protein-tyrosine phosphatase
MPHLLFLCTGNYYRSRFAEILFNHHAQARGLDWQALSRGLALDLNNLGPMSIHTLARLEAMGLPHAEYLRLPADAARNDFDAADHIVAVKEAEHRPLMQRRFPDLVDRVEYWGVHDLDCSGPAEALDHLEQEVLALVNRLPTPRS